MANIRYKVGDTWYDVGSMGGSISEITVDSQLSDTSANPVENRVITKALEDSKEVSVSSTTPTGDEVLWINPDGTGGGSSSGGGVTSLNGKTGALTLKTVDNQSLIGSGNIPLKTRIYKHYLKYTGADSLEEQQAEAYVTVYSTQSTAYTKSSIAGVFGIGERVVCSTRQAAYGTTGWSDFICDSLDNTSNDTLQYKANYLMYLELSSDSVLQL